MDSFYCGQFVRARTIKRCQNCRQQIWRGQLYHKSAGRNCDGDFFSDRCCITCAYYWSWEWGQLNSGDEIDMSQYTFGANNPNWLAFQDLTLDERLTHESSDVRRLAQEELQKIQKEEARLSRHSIHRVRDCMSG